MDEIPMHEIRHGMRHKSAIDNNSNTDMNTPPHSAEPKTDKTHSAAMDEIPIHEMRHGMRHGMRKTLNSWRDNQKKPENTPQQKGLGL